MRLLLAGELRKLLTTRLWLWILLGSIGLAAGFTILGLAFWDMPQSPTPPLESPAGQKTVFSYAQSGYTLIAVLGAIGITAEFRHLTATATFLATPRRGLVVLAKLVAYGLVGLAYGLACAVVVVAVAVPWMTAKGVEVSLTQHGLLGVLAGSVAVVAIYGMVGVGVGALVRNQVATVVGMLIYLFVVESILTSIPALWSWAKFLPGSAASALSQVQLSTQEFLAPWQGGLVLAGYAVVFAVLGTLLAIRRDIT